jgi:hypothetical protein
MPAQRFHFTIIQRPRQNPDRASLAVLNRVWARAAGCKVLPPAYPAPTPVLDSVRVPFDDIVSPHFGFHTLHDRQKCQWQATVDDF